MKTTVGDVEAIEGRKRATITPTIHQNTQSEQAMKAMADVYALLLALKRAKQQSAPSENAPTLVPH